MKRKHKIANRTKIDRTRFELTNGSYNPDVKK